MKNKEEMSLSYKLVFSFSIVMIFISILLGMANGTKTIGISVLTWGYTAWLMYKRKNSQLVIFYKILLWFQAVTFSILFAFIIFADSSSTEIAILTRFIIFAVAIFSVGISYFLLSFFRKQNFDNENAIFHTSENKQMGEKNSFESSNSNASYASFNSKVFVNSDKNNFIHSKSASHFIKNEEELWECALAEFESEDRKKGLYAKHFSLNNGNEKVAKSDYIKERFEQLKAEQSAQQAEILKRKYELESRQTAEVLLMQGAYEKRSNGNFICFYFPNGQAAIKINDRKYRLYENGAALDKSINYYNSKQMFLTIGFIKIIEL